MSLMFPAAVYTADHGYAWSATPAGVDKPTRDALLADTLAARPDFAEADTVTAGVVARNGTAAAFSIRRAPAWDAVGRDADYAAFAFVPYSDASKIDFGFLLANPFFAVPTHTPPAALTYDGPASETFAIIAPGRLLCHNHLERFPASAIGTLLAQYGTKADRWLFLAENGGRGARRTTGEPPEAYTVTTSPWHR